MVGIECFDCWHRAIGAKTARISGTANAAASIGFAHGAIACLATEGIGSKHQVQTRSVLRAPVKSEAQAFQSERTRCAADHRRRLRSRRGGRCRRRPTRIRCLAQNVAVFEIHRCRIAKHGRPRLRRLGRRCRRPSRQNSHARHRQNSHRPLACRNCLLPLSLFSSFSRFPASAPCQKSDIA